MPPFWHSGLQKRPAEAIAMLIWTVPRMARRLVIVNASV